MNRAPKLITIAVALVLTGIAALGLFTDVLSEDVGAWTAVAATAVMVLGVLFRGI